MKTMFTFIAISMSYALAYAEYTPQKDSYATYQITSQYGDRLEKNIIERVNSSRDLYTVGIYRLNDDGTQKLLSRKSKPGFLVKKDFIGDIESYCAEKDGAFEIITLDIGSFKTCETIFDDGILHAESWYAANIPFGLVKSTQIKISNPEDKIESVLVDFSPQNAN